MKTAKKPSILIVAIFVFWNLNCYGQNLEPEDSQNQKILNAAEEIMNSASTCALITLDAEGRARARTMEFIGPESDFTIWFGTNPKSRKVEQIKGDSRVTLYFLADIDAGYVMLYGSAQMIDDPVEKEKRWKPEWEQFYPDKAKSFILIKVIPEWIEVVSYTHGLVGDTVTWEPPQVEFDSAGK